MYYVPDGTKTCGYYECKKCGNRFLSRMLRLVRVRQMQGAAGEGVLTLERAIEYPISNKELTMIIGFLGCWMFRSTPLHAGRR